MDGIDPRSLIPFESLYLGFSGGLDSRVLLDMLCQDDAIRQKLTAVHVHHGLSAHADKWAIFCKKICHDYKIPFQLFHVIVERQKNIEAEAREKRYAVFAELIHHKKSALLLAHHQHDQAETVLLRLFRGAGMDGLSAIPVYRSLGKGTIYRPLLNTSRTALEIYAKQKNLTWIEDDSNQNKDFDRNFLRQQMIPQLLTRWPGLIQVLCRTAEQCAETQVYLDDMLAKQLELLINAKNALSISLLQAYSITEQKLLLRLWLKKQDIKAPSVKQLQIILNEIIPAKSDAQPLLSLTDYEIRRYQGWLYALKPNASSKPVISQKTLQYLAEKHNTSINNIQIRFRQGGEKICWQGKTRDLKTLLQTWKIPPWERDIVPLIYVDDLLVDAILPTATF